MILLVIIVSAFIVIPIAAFLLSKVLGVHEGMEDYDMSGKNVKMDVAKIKLDGETYFGYCLGGDIKCRTDGDTPVKVRKYTDKNGKKHTIYKAKCADDELVKCDGRNAQKIIRDTGISITHEESEDSTNLITMNDMSDNKPEKFLPWDISTNGYVYLYNKQDNIDVSFSACHLYGDCPDEDKKKSKKSKKKESKKSKMKCLADNGAKPGDPLCCGQDGVLQDTKYNCPSEYPHCIGYKCG